MAIGDTFSGLAADQRAQAAQNASNYFQQLAAQRANTSMALDAAARDRAFQLQQQQLADQEAAQRQREQDAVQGDQRYQLEYLNNLQNNRFNQDARTQEADLAQGYFDLKKEEMAQRQADKLDQVDNQGTALAADLSSATQARDDAAQKLNSLETYQAKLKQSALENPMWKNHVLNVLTGVADQMNEARRNLQAADYLFKKANSQAVNLGFVHDPATGRLIHAKTGRSFSYLNPTGTNLDTGNGPELGPPIPVMPRANIPAGPTSTWDAFKARSWGDILVPYGAEASAPTTYFQNRVQNLTPSVTPQIPNELTQFRGPLGPASSSPMPAYFGQERVMVISPDGQRGHVPYNQLQDALQAGYRVIPSTND